MFALRMFYQNLNKNNKCHPKTLKIDNGPIQLIRMGKANWNQVVMVLQEISL